MSEYKYPFLDEQGKPICQMCGTSYHVIAPRHLSTRHNITLDEYKLRFPDAPLSSEQFSASSTFGKEKQLFVKTELEKIEQESNDLPEDKSEDIVLGDEVIVDDEPEVEEFNIVEMMVDSKPGDRCVTDKNKILDFLRSFHTNVRKDYLIEIFQGEHLKEQYITDFCDPIFKIVIQFPNTFWHNREKYFVPNKKYKLEMHGWTVIEINSTAPTYNEIAKAIKN